MLSGADITIFSSMKNPFEACCQRWSLLWMSQWEIRLCYLCIGSVKRPAATLRSPCPAKEPMKSSRDTVITDQTCEKMAGARRNLGRQLRLPLAYDD